LLYPLSYGGGNGTECSVAVNQNRPAGSPSVSTMTIE
jgi:hypothetical protein